MDNVSNIALSGIQAYTKKMDVTANNIANLNSENFQTSKVTMTERQNGGVDATVTKAADQVDISREAINMLTTVNGFKANVQALKADNEMTRSLLDIIS